MENLKLLALDSFGSFKIESSNVDIYFGGSLTPTGDEKLNAESGQPQDLYDDVRNRYIFFN